MGGQGQIKQIYKYIPCNETNEMQHPPLVQIKSYF